MGQDKSSFFEKNISSDLALVLRNFALWVNENDEIWSVACVHEKFFRVPKLRFLAGPASLLDEVSRGTQNWSVRAVTISNQLISVTFQTSRPFLVIWGHFRPFWPFSLFWQFKFSTPFIFFYKSLYKSGIYNMRSVPILVAVLAIFWPYHHNMSQNGHFWSFYKVSVVGTLKLCQHHEKWINWFDHQNLANMAQK